MNNKGTHILLVDDDDIDAEALVRAFQGEQIVQSFSIVPDGLTALNVLRGENGYPCLPRPYLILLDINLPRMNGIEFLQALRQDTRLKDSIVFVLTTSNRDEDKIAAYANHIAGHLRKDKLGKNCQYMIMLLKVYSQLVEFPL